MTRYKSFVICSLLFCSCNSFCMKKFFLEKILGHKEAKRGTRHVRPIEEAPILQNVQTTSYVPDIVDYPSKSKLLELPDEVLVHGIFSYMKNEDIVNALTVCKQLYGLITNNMVVFDFNGFKNSDEKIRKSFKDLIKKLHVVGGPKKVRILLTPSVNRFFAECVLLVKDEDPTNPLGFKFFDSDEDLQSFDITQDYEGQAVAYKKQKHRDGEADELDRYYQDQVILVKKEDFENGAIMEVLIKGYNEKVTMLKKTEGIDYKKALSDFKQEYFPVNPRQRIECCCLYCCCPCCMCVLLPLSCCCVKWLFGFLQKENEKVSNALEKLTQIYNEETQNLCIARNMTRSEQERDESEQKEIEILIHGSGSENSLDEVYDADSESALL